ncbi:flavin-dependent oxidoreductase, F420-dependent methylene-tetrahydromethanopterin reductase [Nostoc sp. PCC 7524]|nr:flavin-dependent oxidoreductase, F420-dependent methylene-tetrahydromethanopterin reductase [Nostoc sp. PCC 7524]
MKTGLFCNYENHHQDARRGIFEQVALVRQAASLGFEEAWISEHHFNETNIRSSILVLMAHLAGVTSTIRLGTAAVLLPFHNPIRVAEDIATLDKSRDISPQTCILDSGKESGEFAVLQPRG